MYITTRAYPVSHACKNWPFLSGCFSLSFSTMRRGTISCSPLKKNLPRQNIKLNVKSRVREAQRKIESAFEERYISLETQRSGKQGAHHIPSWNSSSCALDSVTTEREKKRRRREREREKLSIFLVLCALVISFTYTFLSIWHLQRVETRSIFLSFSFYHRAFK